MLTCSDGNWTTSFNQSDFDNDGPDSATGSLAAFKSGQSEKAMDHLKYYSYGIALPAICVLGIFGNIVNLIVLTRPAMRGPAYVYMRGSSLIK